MTWRRGSATAARLCATSVPTPAAKKPQLKQMASGTGNSKKGPQHQMHTPFSGRCPSEAGCSIGNVHLVALNWREGQTERSGKSRA